MKPTVEVSPAIAPEIAATFAPSSSGSYSGAPPIGFVERPASPAAAFLQHQFEQQPSPEFGPEPPTLSEIEGFYLSESYRKLYYADPPVGIEAEYAPQAAVIPDPSGHLFLLAKVEAPGKRGREVGSETVSIKIPNTVTTRGQFADVLAQARLLPPNDPDRPAKVRRYAARYNKLREQVGLKKI